MSTIIPEAKPGAHNAPDSLAAATEAFRGILSPKGTKRKPGDVSQPEPEDTVEPETPETDEVEVETETDEPEAEEAAETPDESESSDEEAESEVEQPEDESEEADEPPAEKRSRRLKFSDGTEDDVSEDEAYLGYLRTKDYTVKTQRAAEAKQKAEAAEAEARAIAARHAEQLAQVKAAMDRMVPKEPNWTELRKNLTTEEYANLRDEWTAFKAERDRIEAEQAKLADEAQKDYEKRRDAWRDAEFEKLKNAVPEWVDTERGAKEVGDMARYMLSIGYKQEEVDQAVDSRFLLMLRKAMFWDKAQNVGKTKVEPKTKVAGKIKSAPAGSKSTPPQPKSERARAAETLRKEGSLKAATSVFQHILAGKPRR